MVVFVRCSVAREERMHACKLVKYIELKNYLLVLRHRRRNKIGPIFPLLGVPFLFFKYKTTRVVCVILFIYVLTRLGFIGFIRFDSIRFDSAHAAKGTVAGIVVFVVFLLRPQDRVFVLVEGMDDHRVVGTV